ncbi:DUF1642 domain-containing protein [Lactococcus lactis]|uniref:DUF1642 domain-containing protein n=1 Tax=Lactococcus lactis TaxID=1358 RepID=UPI001C1F98D4|nr:DUF1642 domain-containing protein [Lactococcus lactis]MBU7533004.1 DUF1642 domain-containing protein [Lactococcus lactis]
MTKFEKEFKALTSWDWVNVDLIQKILTKFGNWHSDEEFQELLDKYSHLNDNYEKEVIRSSKLETSNLKLFAEGNGLLSDNALLTKEVADLKSQIQQQALPVVPECVAGAIESIPDHYSAFEAIDLIKSKVEVFTEENKDWLQVYNWLCEGIDNQDTFALAFITRKYEVEKPQLFYLKNKLTTSYLALDINTGYYEHWGEEIIPKLLKKQGYKSAFTQQEIDSMHAESYEQFAVPVEDGE